ncbi:cupin domain-containing protein [Natranaerofaba carboxydovora]|uniref:cupin domain-containing protein n=1 Tax=Natranaerofaba carboxydovora TaxID=2742683 RepID=UPI001F1365A8|nr:hypothetical protein [Natranaerofaba carboxydovora]UMZ72763.1 hypothetical protein ACONDI_00289 [Natranaerofaba carboxydovora]
MSLVELSKLESFINKRGIETKKVVQRDEVSVLNLEIKPKENIERHSVDVHVTFVVLRGSGKIIIGEEEHEVEPHNIVLCEPDVPMELFGGEEGLSVLNIKTPNPNPK